MTAVVRNGSMVQLDRQAEPPQVVTEEQAKDPERLARVLNQILKDNAELLRRFYPRRIDYEDYPFDGTGTTKHRFQHGFNGRVRFSIVDWVAPGGGPYDIEKDPSTDNNTLVLVSLLDGTGTLRVEESG